MARFGWMRTMRETVIRSSRRIPRIRPIRDTTRSRIPRALSLAGTALALALATVVVLPGAGSYALWNGAGTANAGSVTGGTVSLSETASPTLDVTFGAARSSSTGGIVVTNTGTVASTLGLSLGFAAGSSSALAGVVAVTVWPVTSTTSCTDAASVPSSAIRSTWGAGALALPSAVAAGGTSSYCIRSSMNVTSASGIASGSSLTGQVTATLTAATWTSTAIVSAAQTFVDDVAPTAPTGLAASTSTTAPVVLSWTAATDNVGVVAYDIYRSGTTARLGTTTSTTYTDSTAAANTSYTYSVYARDAVSLSSPAATVLVDRVAPGQPTLTLTSSTGTSASLSFSSSDAVGVTSFTVYRDGALLATITSPATTYTDSTVSPGTHSYTVTASDAAGNVAALSAAVTASIPIQATSWYEVVNATSGLCITVPAGGISNNVALGLGSCASPAQGGQAWQLPAAGATGLVTSALPNTATPSYSWKSKTTGSGTAILVTGNSTASQWTTVSLAGGLFQFSVNGTSPQLCLDTAGGTVTATTCSATAASQQFTLVKVAP